MRDPHALHFVGADSTWWRWVLGGALYGVALRLLFGFIPHDYRGTMSAAFLVATPMVIGALAVYGQHNRDRSFAFFLIGPWLAIGLMLIGCSISLLEGSICLALMSPLFFACASIGGLAMGLALRFSGRKHSRLKSVALLPLLILVAEQNIPMESHQVELRQSVVIDASPETVWRQILHADSIQASELPFSISHLIGVPKPTSGINVLTPQGEVRFSEWERGVNFRANVTESVYAEKVSWRYVFDDQSFPKGSMDDHVAIGGRYFDLGDTTFLLHALPNNRTRLEIIAHYRVTSSVNLYAVPTAAFIGRDFVDTILGLYKGRSERAELSLSEHSLPPN